MSILCVMPIMMPIVIGSDFSRQTFTASIRQPNSLLDLAFLLLIHSYLSRN
jgi:hypothetical protein